jgi:Aluminium activated malate transporter
MLRRRAPALGCFQQFFGWIAKLGPWMYEMIVALWEFGRLDPRKAVFAEKAGLALAIISLLVFVNYHPFFKEDLEKHR